MGKFKSGFEMINDPLNDLFHHRYIKTTGLFGMALADWFSPIQKAVYRLIDVVHKI